LLQLLRFRRSCRKSGKALATPFEVMLNLIRALPILASASLGLAVDPSPPIVDLGYAKYQGLYDSTKDQNVFRGYVDGRPLEKGERSDGHLASGMRRLR
jgi:hypothetical protein